MNWVSVEVISVFRIPHGDPRIQTNVWAVICCVTTGQGRGHSPDTNCGARSWSFLLHHRGQEVEGPILKTQSQCQGKSVASKSWVTWQGQGRESHHLYLMKSHSGVRGLLRRMLCPHLAVPSIVFGEDVSLWLWTLSISTAKRVF